MGAFLGCNKCLRVGTGNWLPPVFIDLNVGGTGVDALLMMMNFDGDLSSYCKDKVKEAIFSLATEILAKALPSLLQYNTPCFMVQFDSLTVVARCKCNNKDIAEGKGTPEADVKAWDTGHTVYPVDCDTKEGIPA